jgi:pimeloyl-ACP methyl ester carboxylesterase
MAYVTASDGVKLYCEPKGKGAAIVLLHEFGGTCRSFDKQVSAWQSRYLCVAFNARGYPPSDVPERVECYSQDIAATDIGAVLDGLGFADAHLVGVSMGAAAVLQYALRHASRVRSVTLASIGMGSDADPQENERGMEGMASVLETGGVKALAERFSSSPGRMKLKDKNPQAYRRFVEELQGMSVLGAVNTLRGVQKRRPPIYTHEKALADLHVPTLIVNGGNDEGCRRPSEFLQRTISGARFEIIADTGHALNVEEPVVFNRLCGEFIDKVEAARVTKSV